MVNAVDGGGETDDDDGGFTGAEGGGAEALFGPFSRFINDVGTVGDTRLPIVNYSNPINLVGMLATVFGSIWVAFVTGANALIDGFISAAVAPLVDGVGFIVRVIEQAGGGAEFAMVAAWRRAFGWLLRADFGILQFFVAVAMVVLTLWGMSLIVRVAGPAQSLREREG